MMLCCSVSAKLSVNCVTWAPPERYNRSQPGARAMVTVADGRAEREATKVMVDDALQAAKDSDTAITPGADKSYDAAEFADASLEMNVTG